MKSPNSLREAEFAREVWVKCRQDMSSAYIYLCVHVLLIFHKCLYRPLKPFFQNKYVIGQIVAHPTINLRLIKSF
jgi:hypothetical protein